MIGKDESSPFLRKHVRIVADKPLGSVRLLDGLTGYVYDTHDIASGWVKLELDDNDVTPYRLWTIPAERLIPIEKD